MRLTTYSGDSHPIATGSVRPFENLRIDLTWVLAISLALSACGSSEPPATAPPVAAVAAPVTAPAAPAAPVLVDARTSLTLANAAFRQNRIVAPAGDNALEHALNALKQDPENAGANEILVDLTPIAAAAIEAEIAAGNLVEAERVMALLNSANPNSLIVKGLQRRLATASRLAPTPTVPATTAAPTEAPVAAAVPAPVDTSTERETAPAQAPARDTRVVNTPPRSQPEPTTAPAAESEPVASNAPAAVSAPPAAPPPPVRPAGRTSEPIPLVKVQPEYPAAAKKRRTEGWVELQFMVGIDGVPKQIEVIRAQPAGMFDRAAIRAMSRWKFKPAERDGQPVEARAKTKVGFKLG
jgi:periplasmic protein TonB